MRTSLLAALRFVLATVVAGGHTVWFSDGFVARSFNSLGGKVAVVGFLLVSGYSIASSLDRDDRSFYFRRFKRVYPVYFFCVIVAIALELWLGDYQLPAYRLDASGPITAIGNLLMLQTFLVKSISFNGVIWSLAIEVAYYIVSPYLKKMHFSQLVGLIAISGLFFLLPNTFDGGLIYRLALKANAAKYFWPFGMGFLLFYNRSSLLVLVFCIIGSALIWMSDVTPEKFAVPLFVFSFWILIVARLGVLKESRFLDYLGDISYPLYLIQIPTFVLFYRLFGVTNNVALLVISLISACLVYEVIDVRLKSAIFSKKNVSALVVEPK